MAVISKKRLSGVVLGVLLVSLGLHYGPALSIAAPVAVNTETQDLVASGWLGTGSSSFAGELLDGEQYITSWMPNGDSEKLIAQGQVRPELINAFMQGCRYLWSINTGFGWVHMDDPAQEVACPPTFDRLNWNILSVAERVLHSPVAGGVRVELQLLLSFDFTGVITPFTWQTVARDEAHLRPGWSDIAFDKSLYGVGETAVIRYEAGYASSERDGGTWTISLFEPRERGGRVAESWDIGPGPRASEVRYTFASTDFVSGASNVFTVRIFNIVTEVQWADTAVVDSLDLAPVIQSIQVEPPGTRSVGDELTVTVAAAPNPQTGLPLQQYYFHIGTGPTVIVDRWQASNVFTLTIQSDGDLRVSACVRDAERSNCAPHIDILVEEPDSPFGRDNASVYAAPWWLWLSVGILLAFAFGVQFLPQIPQGGRTLLSILFLAGAAIFLLTYLVIPAVEAWIRGFLPGVS